MYQHLLVEHDGPFATITLNRPEKRNALALDVMLELTAALRDVAASDAREIGRAHVCTPVTSLSRMPSSA